MENKIIDKENTDIKENNHEQIMLSGIIWAPCQVGVIYLNNL